MVPTGDNREREKLIAFVSRDTRFEASQWRELWPYRAVREALDLPLDPRRYASFRGGRTRGNFRFRGELFCNASISCQECQSTEVFRGSYETEHEEVMYREVGGVADEDSYYTETTCFYVCLSCAHFETAHTAQSRVLVASPVLTSISEQLAHPFENIRCELLGHFAKCPGDLASLDWRDFEILVESIFRNQGFKTELGPGGDDGGIDLRLLSHDSIGPVVTLVQVKRYAPHRPIRLEVVQALHSVVIEQRANRGLLVTTSRYLPGALEFARKQRDLLALATSQDVAKWCAEVSRQLRSP